MAKDITLSIPTTICDALGEKAVEPLFDMLMQLKGNVYRDVPRRKTSQIEIGGQSYFIKQHYGVGWGEIFKNLLSFKKPVLGAMTEVNAIRELSMHGISTTPLVAFGERGYNPATMQSFVMTEDLGEIITLEDFCANWQDSPPDPRFKAMLIKALAALSGKLHAAGLCHRDFYLCHFVMKKSDFKAGNLNLILIDLHRMLFKQAPNGQAAMKDIAALMFSAKDCGFDEEDWVLFKEHYLPQSENFWTLAFARAEQLHEKFHSEKFQARLREEQEGVDKPTNV